MTRRFDNNNNNNNNIIIIINNNNNDDDDDDNNNNNNNNNNNCNSNIFVTCCQKCWKHVQLQRFAAARNSLIHEIPDRKDL